MDTRQFLVFAGEHVLGFAGLVQFVVETDDFGGLVAIVALGGFVQSADFVQFALQVAVDAFEMLAAFLEVAGVGVGLRSIEKRELYNGRKRERERERESARLDNATHLLQIDDEHFDFALQTRLLLLQTGTLGDDGVDLLLQLGDAHVELASDYFDNKNELSGTSGIMVNGRLQ